MTSLSVLRSHGSQLGRSHFLPALGVRSTHTTPTNNIQLTNPDNVSLTTTNQRTSSIPDRATSHGYSPFKVDFKEKKVEWALARVDDLVNWGRKVGKQEREKGKKIIIFTSGFTLASHLWPCLLCRGDDAHCCS